MDSSLLTLLGGGHHLLDTFDVLSPRWQVVGGTLAVDTGALKAATLGNWLNNLVANGEFTSGVAGGWTAVNVTASLVDSAVDPGAASGGVNANCAKLVLTGTDSPRLVQVISYLTGASYGFSARAYAPSANTRANAASLVPSMGVAVGVTGEDAWESIAITQLSPVGSLILQPRTAAGAGTINDIAYFDAVTCYRQNAAAITPFAPTFHKRLVHIPPAAGVVTPAGWMFRYTSALNYWELRVVPNTAGNDLQIVQVTAGVETMRAEADVDWTADQNDEVLLTVRGADIATAYRKYGSSVWTAGPGYAAATQGIGSPWAGPLQYDTARRWGEAEVWW